MIRCLNIFLVGLLFIFAVAIFFHTDSAITQDLGRHLVLGRIIWEEKHIPQTNFFSYTYPDFPFINHHWGSEVIYYQVNKSFSVNGLIAVKVMLVMLAFGALILFVSKRSDFLPLLFSSILSLEVLRERTEIRPEIFVLLFYSLFLIILYKEKEEEKKFVWTLPILESLWVNMHISFCLGVTVYFLFLADRLLSKKLKIKYFVLGLALIASTLINPAGLTGAIYPLRIFNNYGYSIVENQSPLFLEQLMSNPTIIYFKLAVFLFLLTCPFLAVKKYFFEAAAVFLTAFLSFSAIRHFPFFALSLILPLSLGLTILRQRTFFLWKVFKDNISWSKLIIPFLLFGFLTYETHALVSNKYYKRRNSPLRTGFGQVEGLKATVDFLVKNNLKGPIFNNFDIGSYLIYRLYPKERVFVDGRPEAYPASFFQDRYISMQEDEGQWKEAESRYQFQTIVFSHTDQTPWGRSFIKRILVDTDWKLVYFDDYGLILINKDSTSAKVEFLDTKQKIRDMGSFYIKKIKQPEALSRLANFFNLAQLEELKNLSLIKRQSIMNQ